jgi:hypothetical protein
MKLLYLLEKIKKVAGGYVIMHCSSGKKGRVDATKKPVSKKKALKIHQAIMASKKRRGKI